VNERRPRQQPAALIIALLALLLVTSSGIAQQIKQSPAPDYPKTPFRLDTAQWSEPYDGPLGYPKGAQRASLGIDSRTGGETYYARFPAGSHFALHWHAHAEFAVVLRGKVTHILGTERSSLQAGDYVVIPPKVNHAWEADASGDVYLLIRRDGPADFNFVGQ
jgi:mannose-6-phosphate isomerase-like protein (cupin superfamily)